MAEKERAGTDYRDVWVAVMEKVEVKSGLTLVLFGKDSSSDVGHATRNEDSVFKNQRSLVRLYHFQHRPSVNSFDDFRDNFEKGVVGYSDVYRMLG